MAVVDLDYLSRAHREPPPLLLELEQHSRRDGVEAIPRETARLLSTLVHAMQANRILEVGTAYGYATLWMALALPPAGRIWTIDIDRERTAVALEYLERAGKAEAVDILNQPALEVLSAFPQRNLDIIFIDGPAGEYAEELELCVPLLKRSGLLIIDRVLPGQGGIADGGAQADALRAFHRVFLHHPQLDAVILPLDDGTGIGARVA